MNVRGRHFFLISDSETDAMVIVVIGRVELIEESVSEDPQGTAVDVRASHRDEWRDAGVSAHLLDVLLTRQGEGSTADCDRYVRQAADGSTVDLIAINQQLNHL